MKVLLIVVVYKKLINELSLLQLFPDRNEVVELFVYDNSPFPQQVPIFRGFNIIYQHDANNSGVSRAYNVGALKARELGYGLILLLDQDTTFTLDYLKKYEAAYIQYKDDYVYAPVVCDANNVKIYSPGLINHFVGKTQSFKNFKFEEKYNLKHKSVINSGLMIPLKIFEIIGGFNEKLRLDFSDIYFIEKYKAINPCVILVNIFIKHSLSGDEGSNFLQEFNRYGFYCNGAKELSSSLGACLWWPPLRRLLRLTLKYRSFRFIPIYYIHFLMGRCL